MVHLGLKLQRLTQVDIPLDSGIWNNYCRFVTGGDQQSSGGLETLNLGTVQHGQKLMI